MDKFIKSITFIFIIGLTTFLIAGCEDPINIEVSATDPEYTVDGLITDQPGPHSISISLSGSYSLSGSGLNIPVEGANVSILDDAGNTIILAQSGYGVYNTPAGFMGVAGRHYTLLIQTLTGDEIVSFPELLPEVVPVKRAYSEFVEKSDFNERGHKVYVAFDDPRGIENYYKWKWEGVYQFATWLSYPPGSTLCWRYERTYSYLKILDDKYFDGNEKSVEITLVPYFSGTKYLVTVFQQSLSKEAYNYLKLIQEQISNSGGVFESPPSRIRGNLYCSSDASKNVLGYFVASAVFKEPFMLERSNAGPLSGGRDYPRNTNCWTYPNSVKVDIDPATWPEGWH